MVEKVEIGVRAIPDFEDVKTEAQSTAESVASVFEGIKPAQGGLVSRLLGGGKDLDATEKTLKTLRNAIERTGQSGKALRDVKLPADTFTEAAKALDQIEKRIKMMRNLPIGRGIFTRARGIGLDTDNPLSWDEGDWRRMYGGDARKARQYRDYFFQGSFDAKPQAPTVGSAIARGSAFGIAAHGMKQGLAVGGRQAFGELAATMGVGRLAGAGTAAAGAAGAAGAGGLAAFAGAALPAAAGMAAIGGLGAMAIKGYSEHMRTLESVDSIYKRIGSSSGFSGLADDIDELSHALQLVPSEAAKLADSFIQTANATDTFSAIERMGRAGVFGRAYGLAPGQAMSYFGRAETSGFIADKQDQRQFAELLASTIAGAGMGARSSQIMEDMVGYLNQIAGTLGRSATDAEAKGYAQLLESIYGSDKAMQAGGAQSLLEAMNRLGRGGSAAAEATDWMAFGRDLSFAQFKLFQEAPMTASKRQFFGDESMSETPKWRLVAETIRDDLTGAYGESARENFATEAAFRYGMSFTHGGLIFDTMAREEGRAEDSEQWNKYVREELNLGPGEISFSGLAPINELFELQKNNQAELYDAKIRELAEEYKDEQSVPDVFRDQIQDALKNNDMEVLRNIVPDVVARAEKATTEADRLREAQADLAAASRDLGEKIVPLTLAIQELTVKVAEPIGNLADKIDNWLDGDNWFSDTWKNLKAAAGFGEDESPVDAVTGAAADAVFGKKAEASVVEPKVPKLDPRWEGVGKSPAVLDGPAGLPAAPKPGVPDVPLTAAEAPAVGPADPGWDRYLQRLEEERGLPPGLLKGIESAETTGTDEQRNQAVSSRGAEGRFQAMPKTWEAYGKGDPEDPIAAAEFAADYSKAVSGQLEEAGVPPTIENISAGYNAGPNAVIKFGGVPPYAETQGYVPKVKAKAAAEVRARAERARKVQSAVPAPSAFAATGSGARLDDLDIRDMSDPDFHYGKSATRGKQPFKGIIFHHTKANSSHDAEWYANYGQTVDPGRGGAFGYHYYIDKDGQIVQGAPLDKRTNHVKPTVDVGLSNRNAIGISLIGAEGGRETEAQMTSALKLGQALQSKYGLDPQSVFGHGEVQPESRQDSEGKAAAEALRNAPKPESKPAPKVPEFSPLERPISGASNAIIKARDPVSINPNDAFSVMFAEGPKSDVGAIRDGGFEDVLPQMPDPRRDPGTIRDGGFDKPLPQMPDPRDASPEVPAEIQRAQAEAQKAQARAASASADLNVNINTKREDGSVNHKQYNLSVSEPRVAGSDGAAGQERRTWNYDVA